VPVKNSMIDVFNWLHRYDAQQLKMLQLTPQL